MVGDALCVQNTSTTDKGLITAEGSLVKRPRSIRALVELVDEESVSKSFEALHLT